MQWIHGIRLGVIAFEPVENQISGKENELNFRRQFREQLSQLHVHTLRKNGIFLRFRNGRDRGAMDDELRLILLKFPADGSEVEQVKLVAC